MVLTLLFMAASKALPYRNGFTLFTKKSVMLSPATTFFSSKTQNRMKQKNKIERKAIRMKTSTNVVSVSGFLAEDTTLKASY